MQHRKTLFGLLLAAALVAAAVFLLPEDRPARAPAISSGTNTAVGEAEAAEDTGQDTALAALPEDGSYTARDEVALYLVTYGRLPGNFITKVAPARQLHHQSGSPGARLAGRRA